MIRDWVNLYHMYLFRLILQAKSFVLFYLWYSSCFEVKCWFHTFPKRCSHIPMWILILLIYRDCHPNSISNRCASLQDDPIILPICKINSKFSQRCLFHPSQVVFVFPALLPFFLKDSDFLIKYPFIDGKSPHSFPSMFLSGDSQEDTNGVSSLSFFVLFSSSVDLTQAFGVDHISSFRFTYLPMWIYCPRLLFIHLSQFISGVLKIS